jgi:hypothetical protein
MENRAYSLLFGLPQEPASLSAEEIWRQDEIGFRVKASAAMMLPLPQMAQGEQVRTDALKAVKRARDNHSWLRATMRCIQWSLLLRIGISTAQVSNQGESGHANIQNRQTRRSRA